MSEITRWCPVAWASTLPDTSLRSVVVPAVLMCDFHKHLFSWANLFLDTKQLSYNTIYSFWQCLAPCLLYRTAHAPGIVGQARLLINSAVWTTFTGRSGRICPPTVLPGGHARSSGQTFTCSHSLWPHSIWLCSINSLLSQKPLSCFYLHSLSTFSFCIPYQIHLHSSEVSSQFKLTALWHLHKTLN